MSEYECLTCRNESHDDCYGFECDCMLHGHPEHDTEGDLL